MHTCDRIWPRHVAVARDWERGIAQKSLRSHQSLHEQYYYSLVNFAIAYDLKNFISIDSYARTIHISFNV